MPDGPALDVYLGSKKVIAGVPYRSVSKTFPLPPGTHRIKWTAAGKPSAALEMSADVEAGRSYIAAVVGTRRVYQTILLADEAEEKGAQKPEKTSAVRLRVLHFAPDAPALDVLAVEPPSSKTPAAVPAARVLIKGAAYGKATGSALPAGEHLLEIRPSGFATGALAHPLPIGEPLRLKAAAGTRWTLFVFGLLKGEDKQGFGATLAPED